MRQLVSLEVTSLCAFVFTLLTAERLFSSMTQHVSFQISRFSRIGTHTATMGFLFSSLLDGL